MSSGKRRLWRSTAVGVVAISASWAVQAQPVAPDRPSGSAMQVNLPLLFSDSYLGDVAARVRTDNSDVLVNIDDFFRVTGDRIKPEMRNRLRVLASADGMAAISAMKPAGVDVAYDPAALELHASIPLDQQGERSLKLFETAQLKQSAFEESARVSGSSTFNASQSVSHAGAPFADFDPLKVVNQTDFNIGGPRGVNLFSEFYFDGAESRSFRRGPITITHEDSGKALRLLAGDMSPAVTGFQSGAPLGGFGIERNYSQLQPYRNVRPAGLFKFALEEAATVEVLVNGSPVKTFRLERGQYDIRDFNFASGMNAIEIYVVDDYGRRLIASFSQFFNFDLLDPGISEFAAYVGFPQDRTLSGNLAYRRSPTFTGYYRRGLTQTLTAGVDFSTDRRQSLLGISAGFASKFGTISVAGAVSRDQEAGLGHQLLVSYQVGGSSAWILENPTFDLEIRQRSRNFVALGDVPGADPICFDLRSRFSATLFDNYGIGLYGSYNTRRGLPSTYSLGASFSTNMLGISVSANFERARTDEGSANRVFVSLGRSLGPRQTSRSSYDSRSGSAQFEISRFRDSSLGDYGYRAAFSRDRGGLGGTGEFTYNSNRAFVALRHDVTSDLNGRNITQRTSYSLATQIAFAGNRFGFGRPVGSNFILAYPHHTLKSSVVVSQGIEDEKILARSGLFGPALAPAGAAHSPRHLTVRADHLPDGYDAGQAYFETLPGPATGYVAQVGSDEWRTVQGNLIGPDGRPVALLVGSLRWLDKPEHKQTQIFTNRAGRFVATGLAPGRYELTINGSDLKAKFTVPESDLGIVEAGRIAVREEKK